MWCWPPPTGPACSTECFGDGAAFGLEISYVHEAEPLGTGGAIRNARVWPAQRSGQPGRRAEARRPVRSTTSPRKSTCTARLDAAVTLHLVEVPDPSRFGCVPIDDDGR